MQIKNAYFSSDFCGSGLVEINDFQTQGKCYSKFPQNAPFIVSFYVDTISFKQPIIPKKYSAF